MANEININPTALGSATQSTGPRRMVSDVTIAEQFCIVANDMRNVLQTMRTSLELQRQTMDLFKENNENIEKSMGVQNATIDTIREFMFKNEQHTEILTKNSLMLVRSILTDASFEAVAAKVNADWKIITEEAAANANANTSTGSSS